MQKPQSAKKAWVKNEGASKMILQNYRVTALEFSGGARRDLTTVHCQLFAAAPGIGYLLTQQDRSPVLMTVTDGAGAVKLSAIEYRVSLTVGEQRVICEDFRHAFTERPELYLHPAKIGLDVLRAGKLWTTQSLSEMFPRAKVRFGRERGLQFCC